MGRKNKHITNLASHGHGAADMKSRPRLPQSAGWWILLPAVAVALLAGAGIFSSLNAGPAAPPPGKQVNNFRCIPASNPEMTFMITPNASFITFGVPFTTNEYGFRDRPTIPSAPTMFRILCLGDSVTYGTGVSNQETFPNQLEAMLQQRAGSLMPIDVINAGVSAYNIRNIRAQLQGTIDAFRPNVVVYTFVENDLDDSLSAVPSGDLIFYDPAKPLDAAFIYGSFAPHWMMQKKRLDDAAGGLGIMNRYNQWRNAVPDIAPPLGLGGHHEARSRWAWIGRELQAMRDLCLQRGASFSVMIFGTRNHSEPVNRKCIQICNSLGIPVCSTLPVFDHHTYMAEYSLGYDSHCNPLGCRMMADRVFSFLEDQKVLPPACMRPPSDRRIYTEVMDEPAIDRMEQQYLQAPTEITLVDGAGIIGVFGGIDPQGRMARNCLFRLGGAGNVIEVDSNSLYATPQAPQTLSARIEGGSPSVAVVVPAQVSRIAFAVPEVYWNQQIEIELIAGGPSNIPPPEQRVQGAMPTTVALHRLARAWR